MKIRQALISLSNKNGALEFAQGLVAHGVKLLSTGGTAKMLRDAGSASHRGRRLHGLPGNARRPRQDPASEGTRRHPGAPRSARAPGDLERHGIPTIDLVCVNLYPFRETIAKAGVTLAEAIENIDIGGPAMLRSSAKNYTGVAVVTDPDDYPALLAEMAANDGELSLGHALRAGQEGLRAHRALRRGDRQLADFARRKRTSRGPFPSTCNSLSIASRRCVTARIRTSRPPSTAIPTPFRGFDRQLPAVAGQGTLVQQHRRRRRRLGVRQDLRRPRPA
jgi:AICAR transformylase/IMP cyclohydrolase PurH